MQDIRLMFKVLLGLFFLLKSPLYAQDQNFIQYKNVQKELFKVLDLHATLPCISKDEIENYHEKLSFLSEKPLHIETHLSYNSSEQAHQAVFSDKMESILQNRFKNRRFPLNQLNVIWVDPVAAKAKRLIDYNTSDVTNASKYLGMDALGIYSNKLNAIILDINYTCESPQKQAILESFTQQLYLILFSEEYGHYFTRKDVLKGKTLSEASQVFIEEKLMEYPSIYDVPKKQFKNKNLLVAEAFNFIHFHLDFNLTLPNVFYHEVFHDFFNQVMYEQGDAYEGPGGRDLVKQAVFSSLDLRGYGNPDFAELIKYLPKTWEKKDPVTEKDVNQYINSLCSPYLKQSSSKRRGRKMEPCLQSPVFSKLAVFSNEHWAYFYESLFREVKIFRESAKGLMKKIKINVNQKNRLIEQSKDWSVHKREEQFLKSLHFGGYSITQTESR